MADTLGECKTAGGGADLSARSSVEHDVVPRSTPSVAGAVVCGGDAATPLSASGSSGDVIDSFRMPRSSTPSADGGVMAADITRVVRSRTSTCAGRRPSVSNSSQPHRRRL